MNAYDDDHDSSEDEENNESYSEIDERIARKSLELSMRGEEDDELH